MNSKLFVLILVTAIVGTTCGHETRTGQAVLQGFIDTFVYLVTPQTEGDGLSHDQRLAKTYEKLNLLKDNHIKSYQTGRYDPDANSYFNILPRYETALTLETTYKVDGACFKDFSIMAHKEEDGSVTVSIDLADSESLLCTESIIVSVDADTAIKEYFIGGSKTITFAAPTDEANTWDLHERGPRLFVFPVGLEVVLKNLAVTLALFEPCVTEGVGEMFADMNRDFIRNYVGLDMPARPEGVPEILPIDKNLIGNGDTFDIMRLDGLDPMIAWAMGAATGHTAMALWKEGQLFMCESNAESPYWPVNGIQCNTYEDWMEYGRRNGYNVVWAPLSQDRRDAFNATSAWEFVEEHMGIDYGWEVVLMGLLDTPEGNVLCADAAKEMCIVAEHWEMVFSVAEKVADVAARLFKPAIMQRAQVGFDRPIVEAYYKAFMEINMEPNALHNLPELDYWMYPTTKYGEPVTSDVSICNVFTCKIWRAAGLFGDLADDISCGEFSVNDNYRLKFYEENFTRPDVCVQWDPENPLCQVLGKYKLRLDSQPGQLPRYNYVDLHSGFGNNCPALAPDYVAPQDC